VIEGPAGIGKTSILAETRANLDSNVFYELAAAATWLSDRTAAST